MEENENEKNIEKPTNTSENNSKFETEVKKENDKPTKKESSNEEIEDLGKQLEAFEKELQEAEEELKAVEREEVTNFGAKKTEELKQKFEPVKKEESKKRNEVKKKNHRVLKTILMLIIIALALFLINYARNYYIISRLTEKQAELAKITNYSFVTEHYSLDDANSKSKIEHYHKDGKDIMVRNTENTAIVWSDEKTKEIIFLTPEDLKATVQKNVETGILGNTMPILIQKGSIEPALSIMFLISSEEIDGQDCYKIRWTIDGATIWINKDNGMTVKSMNGYRVVEGKKYNSITEWKEVNFNKLTDSDMSRPNLMGYTVTEKD